MVPSRRDPLLHGPLRIRAPVGRPPHLPGHDPETQPPVPPPPRRDPTRQVQGGLHARRAGRRLQCPQPLAGGRHVRQLCDDHKQVLDRAQREQVPPVPGVVEQDHAVLVADRARAAYGRPFDPSRDLPGGDGLKPRLRLRDQKGRFFTPHVGSPAPSRPPPVWSAPGWSSERGRSSSAPGPPPARSPSPSDGPGPRRRDASRNDPKAG